MNVVGVVHLAEVVERARLLGVGEGIFATIVLNGDVALFDVNVGGAVLAHGAQLDQVAIGEVVAQHVEQVEVAQHVVGLGQHGVLTVDHREGGRALFTEVNHSTRLKLEHGLLQEGVVIDIADVKVDVLTGEVFPTL